MLILMCPTGLICDMFDKPTPANFSTQRFETCEPSQDIITVNFEGIICQVGTIELDRFKIPIDAPHSVEISITPCTWCPPLSPASYCR